MNPIKLSDDLEEQVRQLVLGWNDLVKWTREVDKLLISHPIAREIKAAEKNMSRLFFRRYNQKIKQLTGSGKNKSGKNIWPEWSGKEGGLLKRDLELHGRAELEKLIELFFSDQVDSVASFTRFKTNAGYSYGVFHSMIGKLQMYNGKPKPPCEECGAWKTHYKDCRLILEQSISIAHSREQLEKIREENPDIDLSAAVQQRRKELRIDNN